MTRSSAASTPASRRRFLESARGTSTRAFGLADWALVAGIAIIWGTSFLFIEIGLRAFGPGVVAMSRLLLGAMTLALVPRARRPVERHDLRRIAFLGVIWMGIPLILFPVAQQWIDSSVAGMINGSVPLFAAAWSMVLLRRAPGRPQLVGLAIGFLGTLAISWPQLQGSRAGALGVALILCSVVLYGLSANIAVPLQQRYGSLPVLLRAQLAALALVVPFGLWGLADSHWAWGPALAMLPLGVLGTGLAFVLMTTLIGRAGAPRGAVAIYFVPVVAIACGVWFLGERLAPMAAVGAGLVLLGAWLTSRAES